MRRQLFLLLKIVKQSLFDPCLKFLLPCFLTFWVGGALFSPSANAETNLATQTNLPHAGQVRNIPESLGKIIYRVNAESPSQLYIVGISHRGTFSRECCPTTVKTQTEVYRIGEWLKQRKDLDLLLPEGFFRPKRGRSANKMATEVALQKESTPSLNDEVLKRRLSSHARFVNAEMLLMEDLHMQAGQVEDRDLYGEVYSGLRRLGRAQKDSEEYLQASSALHHLQKMRTAYILQKAPEVIDVRFTQGRIRKREALLTIGLNHLREIISYIKKDKIDLGSSPDGQEGHAARLNLIKEGFGITVIVPHVLAEDRAVLEMTGLDHLLRVYGLKKHS